jgi:aerobic C4-dicarboxylate transport protein
MNTMADEDPRLTNSPNQKKPWYKEIFYQVLIGLGLGIIFGFAFPKIAMQFKFLGDMFLALIKAGVAPLVFLTIVIGITSASDIRGAGKVGVRAIIYFEVVSSIALVLGLIAGNLFHIGQGMSTTAGSTVIPTAIAKAAPPTFLDFFMHIVPDNFFGAFVKGELLQVVVLALIFGAGILALKPERRKKVSDGLDTIADTLFSFINIVMKLAPIGTFVAVAFSVGSNGPAVLLALIQLILGYWALVIVFVVFVLGTICRLAGFSLWRFLRYLREEMFITLGTASSEPALPRLLVKLEDLGCSKQTVGLVLPTGYAFNLDGTSLYMPFCLMFISFAYGVPLGLDQQIGILFIMLLTSKGAATVHGGSFVVFAATVTTVGILPLEGLALLFGVFRFMGMANAFVNVLGNAVATVVVAKWAKDFDTKKAERELYPERS